MERSSKLYDKKFLWNCTLYTTCEPCPKCKDYVAYVAKVDSKDDDSNKNTVLKCGNFEDYLKKKGMLN